MKVIKAFSTALFISIVLHGANAGFWSRHKQEAKPPHVVPLDRHLESGQEDLAGR